jgi:hypothetical protein
MKMRQRATYAFSQIMSVPSHPLAGSVVRKKLTPEDLEERRYFIAGFLFALVLPAPFAWLIINQLS